MKRRPFLCNGRPHRGRCRCHCRCHLCCRCRLCRRHQCRHRGNCPSPLLLLSAIAIAVAVNHRCRHLCCITVSHRCHRRPCGRPLLSPSPSAIAVAIAIGHHHCHAIGHFRELLPWRGKNCVRLIEAKNAYLILFCSDSGRCIDQSRMTDQVLSGDGQHQRWAVSGMLCVSSEGSGWQQGGSRGAEGWRC